MFRGLWKNALMPLSCTSVSCTRNYGFSRSKMCTSSNKYKLCMCLFTSGHAAPPSKGILPFSGNALGKRQWYTMKQIPTTQAAAKQAKLSNCVIPTTMVFLCSFFFFQFQQYFTFNRKIYHKKHRAP